MINIRNFIILSLSTLVFWYLFSKVRLRFKDDKPPIWLKPFVEKVDNKEVLKTKSN